MPVVSRTSWLTWAVVLAIWLVTLAALAGPLFPFTPRPSDIADAVALTPDVDVYLREREAQHPDVKPEQAKAVIWSEPTARIRTPLALVYIHGFSASRRDITPAVENPGEHASRQRLSHPPRRPRRRERHGIRHRHGAGLARRRARSAGPSAAGSASTWF